MDRDLRFECCASVHKRDIQEHKRHPVAQSVPFEYPEPMEATKTDGIDGRPKIKDLYRCTLLVQISTSSQAGNCVFLKIPHADVRLRHPYTSMPSTHRQLDPRRYQPYLFTLLHLRRPSKPCLSVEKALRLCVGLYRTLHAAVWMYCAEKHAVI
jgi:hypothetical protein